MDQGRKVKKKIGMHWTCS